MANIVFMGTPDFSVPILKKLLADGYTIKGVVTQPDRPVGRRQIMTPPPVKVEAFKHGIPVLQPEKIKKAEELEKIFALKPDIIITAAYGQILPKKLLDFPKHGCINVHASLLPKLRGGAPIHHALLQGLEETGITIMYMAEKMDAGDILAQRRVKISERETVGSLHNKLSECGADLLSEILPGLLKGEMTPYPQDHEKATYAYNIKRDQERIVWENKGENIYNQIRGLNPWPVSYTTLNGKILKIWWGEKILLNDRETPGKIIKIEKDGFTVATGNKTGIKVTQLQPAGKKKMQAGDFLRGYHEDQLLGTILGG